MSKEGMVKITRMGEEEDSLEPDQWLANAVGMIQQAIDGELPICARGSAGKVLVAVGDCAQWGGYPQEVPPHILGRAIARAVANCHAFGGDPAKIREELLRGFDCADQPLPPQQW